MFSYLKFFSRPPLAARQFTSHQSHIQGPWCPGSCLASLLLICPALTPCSSEEIDLREKKLGSRDLVSMAEFLKL